MNEIKVTRKAHRTHGRRLWLLAAAVIAAAGCFVLWQGLERQPAGPVIAPHAETEEGILVQRESAEVHRIEVMLRSGERWTVTRQADGTMCTDSGFAVSARRQELLTDALSVIGYTRVLTDDPAVYRDALADFGLDTPKARVTVTYTDGTQAALAIGNNSADYEDETYYYMTLDGDDRLFALDAGTAADLIIEEALLREVTQPVIHKARIDAVTIALPGNVTHAWQLEGAIDDGDAQDRWLLTAPVRYPAEGERVASLRENLTNLRLGAYVAPATPENLAAYGFDAPRMTLTIHQAAGSIGTVGATGEYDVVDWPESEMTFTVGGAQSDVVDYVRYGDDIYLTSHFTMAMFMDLDPVSTVTRYPVRTALGNLDTLTIERGDQKTTYTVLREEQVAPNNQLVYDENGNVAVDLRCLMNGEEIAYSSFEAAYDDLLMTTVSGTLDADWTQTEPVHTLYTFTTRTGVVHTVGLARYDALHDAVIVDGYAMFYLVSGGFGQLFSLLS